MADSMEVKQDPAGNIEPAKPDRGMVFPRGPVPSMYLEELTRIVGSTFTAG
jgi:hypothetical protein